MCRFHGALYRVDDGRYDTTSPLQRRVVGQKDEEDRFPIVNVLEYETNEIFWFIAFAMFQFPFIASQMPP